MLGPVLGIQFICLMGLVEIPPCFWREMVLSGPGGGYDLAFLVKFPINVFLPMLLGIRKQIVSPKFY